MRPSKYGESQIVAILREVEAGLPAAEAIREHGISRATYFTWKQKYGSATVPELTRLRELEQENARRRTRGRVPPCLAPDAGRLHRGSGAPA